MKLAGKFWIDTEGSSSAGHGRIRLLKMVEETGSITKAAQSVGISYKTAWESINTLNSMFDTDLVERRSGGKGGGGTFLTAEGKALIKTYEHFSRIHELYLEDIRSMNSIEAVIENTDKNYASACSGSDVFACKLIEEDIKPGDSVRLYIKPSDIILVTSDQMTASANNLFRCTVRKISFSGNISAIELATENGTPLKVQITKKSVDKLNLDEGSLIFALFKTASVLAVRK